MKKSTRGIFLSFKRKLLRAHRGCSFKYLNWRHYQFSWYGLLPINLQSKKIFNSKTSLDYNFNKTLYLNKLLKL